MLKLDATAFIEQLDVTEGDKEAEKLTRRLTLAELEVARARWEVRVASEALKAVEEPGSDAGNGKPLPGRRRRASPDLTDREIEAVRARLAAKSKDLARSEKRLFDLEQQGTARPVRARRIRFFRLHSAQHHIECSEQRFVRMSDQQLRTPVWVTTRAGRRWWWYLDRFWWDDEGLTADQVKTIVLDTDLDRKHYHDALEEARAAAFGEVASYGFEQPILESVRFAVWRRDGGRCVNCGTSTALEFDYIIPISEGGSDTVPNIELRCRPCRLRRFQNEAQAGISRVRMTVAGERADEIPVAVRQEVWERDEGHCVDCGSRDDLDFDHIVPVAKGGSDIAPNIELRCASCRSRRVRA